MSILNCPIILFAAILGLSPLHEAGFRGEGITIAIIDGGFFRANDEDIFPQEHILGVYDLLEEDRLSGDTCVQQTNAIFDDPADYHGTACLSTMLYDYSLHPNTLALTNGLPFVGTAPDASYIIIRTEDNYAEYPREAERLAHAIHLADTLGADIITISLGYTVFDDTTFNYTYEQMNGMHVASQAATEVAQKGRLICAAMGNDGVKPWHYLSSPADAEGILAVGAIAPDSTAAAFSSYGPSADGRIKPEVAAPGQSTVVFLPQYKDSLGTYIGGLFNGNGTSFATPEIAGMAACLWQALPALSAAELRQLIIASSSNYATPDARIGYGIPNAAQAWKAAQTSLENSIEKTSSTGNGVLRLGADGLYIEKAGHRYTLLGQPIQEKF